MFRISRSFVCAVLAISLLEAPLRAEKKDFSLYPESSSYREEKLVPAEPAYATYRFKNGAKLLLKRGALVEYESPDGTQKKWLFGASEEKRLARVYTFPQNLSPTPEVLKGGILFDDSDSFFRKIIADKEYFIEVDDLGVKNDYRLHYILKQYLGEDLLAQSGIIETARGYVMVYEDGSTYSLPVLAKEIERSHFELHKGARHVRVLGRMDNRTDVTEGTRSVQQLNWVIPGSNGQIMAWLAGAFLAKNESIEDVLVGHRRSGSTKETLVRQSRLFLMGPNRKSAELLYKGFWPQNILDMRIENAQLISSSQPEPLLTKKQLAKLLRPMGVEIKASSAEGDLDFKIESHPHLEASFKKHLESHLQGLFEQGMGINEQVNSSSVRPNVQVIFHVLSVKSGKRKLGWFKKENFFDIAGTLTVKIWTFSFQKTLRVPTLKFEVKSNGIVAEEALDGVPSELSLVLGQKFPELYSEVVNTPLTLASAMPEALPAPLNTELAPTPPCELPLKTNSEAPPTPNT